MDTFSTERNTRFIQQKQLLVQIKICYSLVTRKNNNILDKQNDVNIFFFFKG